MVDNFVKNQRLLSVKSVMPVHRVQIRDRSGPTFTVISNMGSANSVSVIATKLLAGLSGVRMPVGTSRDSVRSTRGLGPTMTARGQSIGISIGMLPQTLIMSITVQKTSK